jgi:hypothetical protein
MKISLSIALLAAISAFSASGTRMAAAEECTGPFRQCALSVSAVCSRDSNGRQRMTYWDGGGRVIAFEQCVARIFAANGQPNPYTTGSAGSGGLQVPYTELLYPMVDP